MPGTSLASLSDLAEAGAISEVGLRLTDTEMPYERFEALCVMIGQAHTAIRFAIGDAILFGEAVYGEQAYQAFEYLKVSPDTKNRYRRVAERIPLQRRRPELSWSHHFLVCTLEPPEQDVWLETAVVNDYSKHDLYARLKALPPLTDEQPMLRCPSCGAVAPEPAFHSA